MDGSVRKQMMTSLVSICRCNMIEHVHKRRVCKIKELSSFSLRVRVPSSRRQRHSTARARWR